MLALLLFAGDGSPRSIRPRKVSFPRDHGSHDDARVEWWYVTGQLDTASGRRLGYQLTFFRTGIEDAPKGARASAFAARDLFLAHFALTDAAAGTFRFAERMHRTGVGAAFAREDRLDVANEDWRLEEVGGRLVLFAADGGDELSLLLTPEKPPVLHGENGLSRKGPEPDAVSRYVSLTRLRSRGLADLGRKERGRDGPLVVRPRVGLRFDRQGGTAGWDWFALHLRDGRDLMLYRMRGAGGPRKRRSRPGRSSRRTGARDAARGRGLHDRGDGPLEERAKSGGDYPARWVLRVPRAEIAVEVVPLVEGPGARHREVHARHVLGGRLRRDGARRRAAGTGVRRDDRLRGHGRPRRFSLTWLSSRENEPAPSRGGDPACRPRRDRPCRGSGSGFCLAPRRPRIGIAFAGGGARGGAHVGVLKVLEEMRVPVDYVAGTSIGSIVAALYASGMSPDEMEKVLSATDWDDALRDDQGRKDQPYRQKEDDGLYLIKAELGFNKGKLVLPQGVVSGQKLNYLLRRLTLPSSHVSNFDRLTIPFRCVATDIVTGAKVVLTGGDLARAVRASMAIPGFFSPVEIDGKLLTDGGTADNLPVDVVRDMGADVVIAIDISTPLVRREKLTSFLSIAGQTSGFLTRLNVEEQIRTLRRDRDVLVTPDLETVDTLDFKEFPKASEQGRLAADGMREKFASFSVSEAEYAAFLEKQRQPRTDPVIHEVRIETPPGVSPRLVEGRVETKPGSAVSWPVLERDLARLYELGDYETVDFRVETESGRNVLILGGAPKPPAPQRVRFGLKLDTDFASNSSFGLRLGVYFTRMNALRGELRTKVEVGRQNSALFEFYQPTDYHGRFFVSPTVSFTRLPQDVFVEDVNVARIRTDEFAGALDLGVSLGSVGELRAGIYRAHTNFRTDIFTGAPVSGSVDVAALRLRAFADKFDSATFPRDGWGGSAEVFVAGNTAGGDDTFAKLKLNGGVSKSSGETTLSAAVTADLRIGPNLRPSTDQAPAGGFLNLSGLAPGQLYGDNACVARLVAYRRLARMNSLLGTGVFAGVSIETGNAWSTGLTLSSLRLAGSAFVAADTSLGPLFLAYGLADRGFHSFTLALGVPLN